MPNLDRSEPEEPVEPDAASELVLILADAFIAAAPQRLGGAFVRELAEMLRAQTEEAEVVKLTANAPAKARARRRAFSLLRRALPEFVSRLRLST